MGSSCFNHGQGTSQNLNVEERLGALREDQWVVGEGGSSSQWISPSACCSRKQGGGNTWSPRVPSTLQMVSVVCSGKSLMSFLILPFFASRKKREREVEELISAL